MRLIDLLVSIAFKDKETDLIYEGIATKEKTDLTKEIALKETDLIYEGIATLDNSRFPFFLHKETDLIYEGIATDNSLWC